MSKLYEFSDSNGNPFTFDGKSFKIFEGIDSDINIPELSLEKAIPCPRTLALTITNNCNMGCSYCYAGQGSWDIPGLNMSQDIAFLAIDLLINSIKKVGGNFATISFFGGEPLLRLDFISDIVLYAKQKASSNNINLRFAIVTNGTLLNNASINFLIENNFILSLSIDGPSNLHDFYRKFKNGEGTYKIIQNNSQVLLGKIPILVRPTISDHNYNVDEVIQHLVSIGFKRLTYEVDHNISEIAFEEFLKASERLFLFYLKEIKSGHYFDFRNITRVLASLLIKKRSKSHCNAGVGYLCCSADGLIYPCHRFIGNTSLALGGVKWLESSNLLGLVKSFDEKLLNGPCDRSIECAKCPFDYICGGTCLYHSYVSKGVLFSVLNKDCLMKKVIFDQVLRLMVELRGKKLHDFVDYLKETWKNENRFGETFQV